MSLKSRDDIRNSCFIIDPVIVADNQAKTTIQKSYEETYGLDELGINAYKTYRNFSPALLIEKAITNGEGILTETGTLSAIDNTSSTDNIFITEPAAETKETNDVCSRDGGGRTISRDMFRAVIEEAARYLCNKEVYVFDGFAVSAGEAPQNRSVFRVINELPSQNVFVRGLFISPKAEELELFSKADHTILIVPGLKCNAKRCGLDLESAVVIDPETSLAVIAGPQYSGEITETVCSIVNGFMSAADKA